MSTFAALVALLIPLKSFGFIPETGDVVLQSANCYLCAQIEAVDQSNYSHIGLVVEENSEWKVLEAEGTVRKVSLADFLKRNRPGSLAKVLRHRQGIKLNPSQLLSDFRKYFEGLHYDSQFLWNNYDERGEKLYCSEFVTKFLTLYFSESVPTKEMKFEVNRDFWIRYFHGSPPDGKPGNSPGDYDRSPLFEHVGYL